MDEDRENCRRMYDETDEGVFVPLCDHCYWGEEDDDNSYDDNDDNNSSDGSSHTCYCAGCGNEIDWDITEKEYEQENGNVLCNECSREEDLSR